MQVRDWDLVIGAQYDLKLTKTDKLTLGATFSPKKSLRGNTWVTVQSWDPSSSTSSANQIDTVAYTKMNGKYETPMSVGAGVAYSHERSSKWMVEADLTFQQWSKAKYSPL